MLLARASIFAESLIHTSANRMLNDAVGFPDRQIILLSSRDMIQFGSPATTAPPTVFFSAVLYFGTSFVNVNGPARKLRAIQLGNRLVSLIRIGHLYECKASRSSGVTIRHECYSIYLAVLRKELTQVILSGMEIEITNKYVFHGASPNR
jgi:hypothetical protein